ncbi:MAG: structural protein P5 [Dysgonamonadaceae bacterium]|nr:structural protein P5 [Dysgonamonadaceae bacterium]
MAKEARGIRNNNPLNIRHNGDLFQGEIRPGTDKLFKQFSSPAYGYRAAFITLGTYWSRGWNTIEKIVGHWAPPNENNTEGYIEKVEKWSQVKRDKVLTANDGDAYIAIVMAMSLVENGVSCDMREVRAGFALQNKLKSKLLSDGN